MAESKYPYVKKYRKTHGHLWYKYDTKTPDWITATEIQARLDDYIPEYEKVCLERESARTTYGSRSPEYNTVNQNCFRLKKMIDHWIQWLSDKGITYKRGEFGTA